MGLVKNYYHDEIIAAQDDQRADEFDCYEARLHSLLSELDWLQKQAVFDVAHDAAGNFAISYVKEAIKDMMK